MNKSSWLLAEIGNEECFSIGHDLPSVALPWLKLCVLECLGIKPPARSALKVLLIRVKEQNIGGVDTQSLCDLIEQDLQGSGEIQAAGDRQVYLAEDFHSLKMDGSLFLCSLALGDIHDNRGE